MKLSEFAKELERVGLKKKHADKAFAWIRKHGKRGAYDVLYYRTRPSEKAVWWVQDKEGHKYFMKETAVLMYLFARKDKDKLAEDPPFNEEWKADKVIRPVMEAQNHNQIVKRLEIDNDCGRYPEDEEEYGEDEEEIVESDEELSSNKIVDILEQFNQIIFYGPPGTGKTRRAKLVVARLFGFTGNDDSVLQKLEKGQGKDKRWNIIQFHPSYNYEDFVRGIKVETAENDGESHVSYKTVNRIFGEMCDAAAADPDEYYALIIDEINRANVSAVLGELIYALEYRGKPVKTPYEVDGKKEIIVPDNLYIIGTMNSADRTIGQIDYAVRRRFAFVHCLPDKSVITNPKARDFFDEVDAIFTRHISQDYDADDVRIGHSYFLASGIKLVNKMIYQVIPILREYVKDGVLKKDAISEIDELRDSLS